MDQAFQLAQSSYMKYLKYKINELILVYKASLLVQDMSNGPIMKSTFPVTYYMHDKNTKKYLYVSSVSSGQSSSSSSSSTDSVESSSEQSSVVDAMIEEKEPGNYCHSTKTPVS